MIRKVRKIICIALFLVVIMTTAIFAKTIYDMQKVNVDVIKPTSSFEIYYERPNGESGIIESNSKFYDSDVYSFDQKPNKITLEYGSKISIRDTSSPGDGTKMSWYDFQMYTPTKDNLIYTNRKSDFEKTYTLNESGNHSFYLSVMDNNQNINGYDNWSINGNHRWLAENKNNRSQMFYWYFSQIDIYVLGKDEVLEEKPDTPSDPVNPDKPEEDEKPKEDEEEEIENHVPTIEFVVPRILYPKEITDEIGNKNTIRFIYYDEDGDAMDVTSYSVYNVTHGKKLIDEKDLITSKQDMFVTIEGDMNEEFQIVVITIDEAGAIGRNSITVKINELFPNVSLSNYDRTYLNEYLDINVYRNDDNELKYLKLNYNGYKIYNENKQIIIRGDGLIPNKLYVDYKFKENETYYIEQIVSNSYGTKKTLKSNFYVVEIEKPIINIDGGSLYYGDSIDTNCVIVQPQSRLKGSLKNYNYDFTDDDISYEIYEYESNKLVYKSKGIPKMFVARETNGIIKRDYDTTYKMIVYATNGAKKTNSAYAYFVVKQNENEYIKLEILERDNDEKTKCNEIYSGECLDIETIYNSKNIKRKNFKIIDENENTMLLFDHYVNGLLKIDLEPGVYTMIAELDNGNTILFDKKIFFVKQISKPVIEINSIKNNYTKLDKMQFDTYIYDVNRSEEHPNGFELINSYSINNIMYAGEIKDINLSNYDYGKIEICQFSVNKEHSDILQKRNLETNISNILPMIEANYKDEYYVGENVEIVANAFDKDGTIKKLISNSLMSYDEYDEIVSEKQRNKIINFVADKPGIVVFEFETEDDYGDICIKYVEIKIIDSNFYPYFDLLTTDDNNMKENRYLRARCGTKNADGFEMYFENQPIKLNNIGDIFDSNNLKMILENIDDGAYEVGFYFKNKGNYKIEILANKKDFASIKRIISFDVKEDEVPLCLINDSESLIRSNEDNRAKLKIKPNIKSDDEIAEISIFVDDLKRDVLKDDEFKFNVNELGTKKLKLFVQETHKYLPNVDHLFYYELIEKMKSSYSNEMIVNIENVKPKVQMNTKTNTYKIKYIN